MSRLSNGLDHAQRWKYFTRFVIHEIILSNMIWNSIEHKIDVYNGIFEYIDATLHVCLWAAVNTTLST